MLRPLDVVGIMYHFTESSLSRTIVSETDIACISLHLPFSRFLFREETAYMLRVVDERTLDSINWLRRYL